MNPDLLSPQSKACATTRSTLASPPSPKGAFAAEPPGNVLGWGALCVGIRKPNRRISGSSIRDKHMFTGCPALGEPGCASESSLWFWFFRYLAAAQDVPLSLGHGLKLQQHPGWHNGTMEILAAVHAAIPPTTLAPALTHSQQPLLCLRLKPSTLKAKKQSRACKTWVWSHHSLLLLSWLGSLGSSFHSWRQDEALLSKGSATGIKALGRQIPVAQPALQPQGVTNTYLNHLAGFAALPEIPVVDAMCSLTSVSLPAFTQAF